MLTDDRAQHTAKSFPDASRRSVVPDCLHDPLIVADRFRLGGSVTIGVRDRFVDRVVIRAHLGVNDGVHFFTAGLQHVTLRQRRDRCQQATLEAPVRKAWALRPSSGQTL